MQIFVHCIERWVSVFQKTLLFKCDLFDYIEIKGVHSEWGQRWNATIVSKWKAVGQLYCRIVQLNGPFPAVGWLGD